MPIYEYQCQHCEHKMEVIQKIGDTSLKYCPECKQETMRKLVSAAAFKLKGEGWYETDFKDKKPQKNDKEKEDNQSSKDKGGDKTGGSDKSESKSEPTTEKPKKKAPVTKNSKE